MAEDSVEKGHRRGAGTVMHRVRAQPLWAQVRGQALIGEVKRHPPTMCLRQIIHAVIHGTVWAVEQVEGAPTRRGPAPPV